MVRKSMDAGEIEEVLINVESELDRGNYEAVRNLGFWRVVRAAKKDPEIGEKFAEMIGEVDKILFDSKARIKLDFRVGTIIELIGAVIGVVLLYFGATFTGILSTILYAASAIVLMTALHPISHIIAANRFGIKFHFYFLNGPMLIEPTLKVDYSTYLKAPPKSRALFHLVGAVNSIMVTLFVLVVVMLDPATMGVTVTALAALWLATTASEIFPLLFIKLGIPKILFADFRKSDSYRALREWRMVG
jgi:hypothetical protein